MLGHSGRWLVRRSMPRGLRRGPSSREYGPISIAHGLRPAHSSKEPVRRSKARGLRPNPSSKGRGPPSNARGLSSNGASVAISENHPVARPSGLRLEDGAFIADQLTAG